LKGEALVVDLKDDQRGLVWIDGRFAQVLPPGLYAYWTGCRAVRVEVASAARPRFEHADLKRGLRTLGANSLLEVVSVGRGCVGVLFLDGMYAETLPAGEYAFWRGVVDVRVLEVDLREATLDIAGQDIMTADKLTLRLNALVTYQVVDPRRAVLATSDDVKAALYREAQMALRAAVGARELDALLTDKDALARDVAELLRARAADLGLNVLAAGVRDVILPGDMKELMNKVTEARKAAEANLIMRREETAALRSQANSAKLLADNPVLMRLRELEVLEKVAGSGKLNVVLGESKLAEKVLSLV
jgi:regulator of protease activity HflC (stomatin/prohibitin superfamily)